MLILRALGLLAASMAMPALAQSISAQGGDRVEYTVAPNEADPSVEHFFHSSVVIFDRRAAAPLLLFLPGTGVSPAGADAFLNLTADAGYRVISLGYNNRPAVMRACERDPDPACSANFRQRRLLGDPTPSAADDQPDESIVNRLTRLLQFLDKNHPGEGWATYLANGSPDWNRIAVAGFSQGAGMAAFLAKRTGVARVVLLSGPIDFVLPGRQPAPWLAEASSTPGERWFGLYHGEERDASLLQQAYRVLGVPPDHIRVLGLGLGGPAGALGDAFHWSAAADPAYAADWAFLLGGGR